MTDAATGFRLCHAERVRYSEADPQKIVFNANYLVYADIGVTEYYRALSERMGLGPHGANFLERVGGDCMLRHADVDYRASARADDMIDICLRVTRFGRTSFSFLVHILRGEELLTVIGLTYVWFDPETRATIPVPEAFIEAVEAFEEIAPERAARA